MVSRIAELSIYIGFCGDPVFSLWVNPVPNMFFLFEPIQDLGLKQTGGCRFVVPFLR